MGLESEAPFNPVFDHFLINRGQPWAAASPTLTSDKSLERPLKAAMRCQESCFRLH